MCHPSGPGRHHRLPSWAGWRRARGLSTAVGRLRLGLAGGSAGPAVPLPRPGFDPRDVRRWFGRPRPQGRPAVAAATDRRGPTAGCRPIADSRSRTAFASTRTEPTSARSRAQARATACMAAVPLAAATPSPRVGRVPPLQRLAFALPRCLKASCRITRVTRCPRSAPGSPWGPHPARLAARGPRPADVDVVVLRWRHRLDLCPWPAAPPFGPATGSF